MALWWSQRRQLKDANSLCPLNTYHPENSQAPYWISHCNYDVHPLVSHACPAILSLPSPAPLLIAHCTVFHYFQTRKLGENSLNFQSYNLTPSHFPPSLATQCKRHPSFFLQRIPPVLKNSCPSPSCQLREELKPSPYLKKNNSLGPPHYCSSCHLGYLHFF